MDYLLAMRAFVRTVDLGSFSKAAAEAGAKTSSISRYVAALETDLGVALLNRSTRRLRLTEAGGLFYQRASRILEEVEDARSATARLNDRPQGLLRLNIPGSFGRRHIVPLLADFLAAYPLIRLDTTLTDETVDLIAAGADVAVRIGALPDSTLVARKLAPHRRMLCASPDCVAALPPVRAPADLPPDACLPFALQPTDRWHLHQPQTGAGAEVACRGRLRANDSEALRHAALAGIGIALLPTWLVGPDIRDGRLVALLPDWRTEFTPRDDRAIWGVYPPKRVVAPKVRVFLDFLAQRFGRPAVWDREIPPDPENPIENMQITR